ncbi:MAG TPA: transcriptional regulator NrdR [Dictyoglomaceae bacterium]|nr:transcriptional regulator NrdR [Dictyoglomaceae bacterium]HOL39349.1 transcriptional regulator NrdR [Dictyoglomaceae bacterium]HOP94830.1 transcriptional regulator NrdR [Dictyoglomaceae bacterium]HPP15969.1 transcriptional regulator NrdR [Dictyoglomaceae bacterium]HPU43010.1 transcriptional regulator NrdR [Dictyoglomaceae bacterium]
MKCPFCGYEETLVIDTREIEEQKVVRRRRQCLNCKERFTTYERIEEKPIMVIKKDGRREPFDRNKLLAGLQRAVVKRNIESEKLETIIDEIIGDIKKQGVGEITSKEIGEKVLEKLKNLDAVAYIRFASVYQEFSSLEEFTNLLSQMKKE